MCEDTDNPYIFVSSKDALGAASSTKRPTSCVMIVPGGTKKGGKSGTVGPDAASAEEYGDEYKSIYTEAKTMGEKLLLNVA